MTSNSCFQTSKLPLDLMNSKEMLNSLIIKVNVTVLVVVNDIKCLYSYIMLFLILTKQISPVTTTSYVPYPDVSFQNILLRSLTCHLFPGDGSIRSMLQNHVCAHLPLPSPNKIGRTPVARPWIEIKLSWP